MPMDSSAGVCGRVLDPNVKGDQETIPVAVRARATDGNFVSPDQITSLIEKVMNKKLVAFWNTFLPRLEKLQSDVEDLKRSYNPLAYTVVSRGTLLILLCHHGFPFTLLLGSRVDQKLFEIFCYVD